MFDIRKGEIGITLLMFLYIYLILVAYYFLKPARDSLFLVKLGFSQLPWVYILIAVIVVPITTIYSRAARSIKLVNLITATTVIIISNLIILRWLLGVNEPWVYYVFYIWVSIYGILTTSQFWLLANAVYDARQAKRVFVPLGLAAILGAITGAQVTSLIVSTFNIVTEDLLWFCVGFMAICIPLVYYIWHLSEAGDRLTKKPRRVSEEPREKFGQVFSAIKSSRHLTLIVGIITMTMMVASFVDFQFKTVASQAYPDKESLTAFFASFYGYLSLAGLFFQAVLSYRFLKWLGVGGSIMFLPAGLLIGTVGMLIAPGLVAGVMLRGVDGAFKYSIDKTARELLFLPIPAEVKKRTKIFIDMFVDRWSRGLAGVILLGMLALLDVEANPLYAMRILSIPTLLLIVAWMVVVFKIRKEYVNTFRKALERREIDLSEVRQSINEVSTVNALIAGLGSTEPRQIVYSLKMLEEVDDLELVWPIKPLLQHHSPEVRQLAARVLQRHGTEIVINDLRTILGADPCLEVRLEAMQFLATHAPDGTHEFYKKNLDSAEASLRLTALATIANYGNERDRQMITDSFVQKLLSPGELASDSDRAHVVASLGKLGRLEFSSRIGELLTDTAPEVIRETITTIGLLKDREHVPWLINALGSKRQRAVSRNSLAEFGVTILGTLNDYLLATDIPFKVRKNIPAVMALMPQQASVDTLTASVGQVEPQLKYFVVKALNRLRNKFTGLKFNKSAVDSAFIEETRNYYEMAQALECHRDAADDGATKLLVKALQERLDANLERIFRLLGLYYPPGDIYDAYRGIVSQRKSQRAAAVELLDNLLKSDVKKYLLPIIDEVSPASIARRGEQLFGVNIRDGDEALALLIKSKDAWLRACAVFCGLKSESSEIRKVVAEARNDPDPVVRETAMLAGTQ